MKIFDDHGPQRNPSPHSDDILIEFQHTGWDWLTNVVPSLVGASISYCSLLEDLLVLDPKIEQTDAKDLVDLIWYLHKGPMLAGFYKAWRYWKEDKIGETLYLNAEQARVNLIIRLLQVELARRGTGPGGWLDYSLAVKRNDFPKLSSMGPLELLVRVLAVKRNSVTLSMYRNELGNLNISKALKEKEKSEKLWVGVPRVLFICTGHTVENALGGEALHIITTSGDKWGGLKPVDKWCKEARAARIKTDERQGDAGFEKRNKEFYDQIYETVETKKKEKKGPLTKKGVNLNQKEIIAIRLAAIKTVQDNHRSFNHAKELASPIKFPDCAFLARCFKCRAFFAYDLPQETRMAEAVEKSIGEDERYEPDSCAEVLAHCFCTRQSPPSGH